MSKTTKTVVKTIVVKTPHGPATVPRVTSHFCPHYKRAYYTTHAYNSMAQPISGGFQFPASCAKTCAHYGVPVIPHTK